MVLPSIPDPGLSEALKSRDRTVVARALRSLRQLTGSDAARTSDWIRREARRWEFSRQRRRRVEDPYIDCNEEGLERVERPKFDELSSALVRNHPEDVAKHFVAGLPRPWIIEVADWIEQFFARKTGRPKTDPIDRTIAAAWLNLQSKEQGVDRTAKSLGWPEPDRASKERGNYTGVSPRSIARARKIVKIIQNT